MNQDKPPIELIHGYLDGMLTSAQEQELNDWIKLHFENALVFADYVRIHDLSRDLARTRLMLSNEVVSESSPKPSSMPRLIFRLRRQLIAASGLALLVSVIFGVWWTFPATLSASTELNRLIAGSAANRDGVYRIRSLDEFPEQVEERRPPIDGAILYVRQPDQYVLVRKFPDGRSFVTGSDGGRSWAVPPNGSVRVSRDPERFRGPLPGNQLGIPFVNLRTDLVVLRESYDITLLDSTSQGLRGLLAIKKSNDHRGPREVELWYDSETDVIKRMVFAGMPRARVGPDRVSVEWQASKEFPPTFFEHQFHHSPDRKVVEED